MTRILLLVLLGFTATSSDAQAAAPRILILSGAPLREQVVIADWQEIFVVVAAIAPVRPVTTPQPRHRPSLKVSLFWGPRWNEYLASGKKAEALRPRHADQSGRFFPAWRGRRALLDLPWAGGWPRPVPPRALAVLKRYGVPIRLG